MRHFGKGLVATVLIAAGVIGIAAGLFHRFTGSPSAKQNSSPAARPPSVESNGASERHPASPSPSVPSPRKPSSPGANEAQDRRDIPEESPSYAEAYERCPYHGPCRIPGNPWEEYESLKKTSEPGAAGTRRAHSILTYLMGHLDQVEYRAPAKRIIEAEFKSTSTLYRDYMGRYHHETGNDVEAKRLYDDLFNSYDGTEFIPWMNLGNFYRDTGDYERALECFERSRNRIGEEHAIVERSHEGESYLDRQILELREKIAQKQRQ